MINMPSAEQLRQLGRYDFEKEMEKFKKCIVDTAKTGEDHIEITKNCHSTLYDAIMDNYDKIGPYLKDLGYTINFTDNMQRIIIRWNE